MVKLGNLYYLIIHINLITLSQYYFMVLITRCVNNIST